MHDNTNVKSNQQRNMLLKLHKDQRVARKGATNMTTESVMAIEIHENDQLVTPVTATVKWRRVGRHFITLKLDKSPLTRHDRLLVDLANPIDEIIRNTSNTNRLQTHFA
jgi:hypothetical protein